MVHSPLLGKFSPNKWKRDWKVKLIKEQNPSWSDISMNWKFGFREFRVYINVGQSDSWFPAFISTSSMSQGGIKKIRNITASDFPTINQLN
jgi:hypothetical protein